MSEDLEDFIKDNLNELDQVEQPDTEQFWADFQKVKKPAKRFSLWKPITIAASLLLLIGFFAQQSKEVSTDPMAIENLRSIDPQLAEYQAILISTIAEQDSLIQSMNIAPEEYQDIYDQLKELDKVTAKYKEDLKKYGPDRKIIKTLLECSKRRIKLYELLLHEIELKTYYDELDKQQSI